MCGGLSRRRAGSTLLIPVHRPRRPQLRALLASVASARPSPMFPVEVRVVTRDIEDIEALVRTEFPRFPARLTTGLFPDATTVAALRNRAISAVETEWLHFVDSDTLIPADYFARLDRAMRPHAHRVPCFQLGFAPAPSASCWARYEAEVDRWVISRYVTESEVLGLNGMNLVARPEALSSAGGFAEDLVAGEDIELGYRLHSAGVPVLFLREVGVQHRYPESLRLILRRKYWHGQGYAQVFRRCPGLFRRPPDAGQYRLRLFRTLRRPRFLFYLVASHLSFYAGVAQSSLQGVRAPRPVSRL